MEFVGSGIGVNTIGYEKNQGYRNYFLGHIPDGVTNVNTFKQLRYSEL